MTKNVIKCEIIISSATQAIDKSLVYDFTRFVFIRKDNKMFIFGVFEASTGAFSETVSNSNYPDQDLSIS
jgi:hypothetical protein